MGDEEFAELARKMPTHWTCVDCKGEFPAGPFDSHPVGFRTEDRKQPNGYYRKVVVGKICKQCWEHPKK